MDRVPLELITIVAETVLEDTLTRGLLERGATGYTVTASRGRGSRGVRTGEVPGEGIRIEVIVGSALADDILGWINRQYFPHYAVIAWAARVEVVRGDKYVAP